MTDPSKTKREDGGPAFPNERYLGDEWKGMSLRDYFAGQFIAGFSCATKDLVREFARKDRKGDWTQTLVTAAYEVADAMLRAREEKP